MDEISQRYQELVEKRDRHGIALHPRLKMKVKRVWKETAFVEGNFAISDHVRLVPKALKPLTEDNIEKVLMVIGLEQMSRNFSPWEVIVAPITNEDLFYMLIRIHKLIVEEQKSLNIREMTNRLRGKRILSQEFFSVEKQRISLLSELTKNTKNILLLYEKLVEFLSDKWNRFVLEHDSLDHYDGFCRRPEDLFSLFSSIVITLYGTHKEYKFKLQRGQSGAKVLSDVFSSECEKRELSNKLIVDIVKSSLNPVNAFMECLRVVWWSLVVIVTLSPFYVLREIEAIRSYIIFGSEASGCLFGFTLRYFPVLLKASNELFEILKFLLNLPRLLIEDKKFRSKIIAAETCNLLEIQ